MNTIEIASSPSVPRNDTAGTAPVTFPSLQRLLDVISSIIAEEYIIVAKDNPEVFLGKKIASGASRPRNDTEGVASRNNNFPDYNDGGKK